ncbi:hypothetical protein CEXT_270491 [Caerostris extrusa]|uniref:Uncharacterized protein n=1 Tax=Caerostris extrusa TaxID=172846 RepID=A0AAV4XNQ2_CAEEX|nr:hypothetical protein CEXT_270491 [Caerostris extrusa]
MTAQMKRKAIPRPLNLPLRKRFRCDRNSLILFGGQKICQNWGGLRVCLSAACEENVGSFNISFIQGNFRPIIAGDSGGRSQANDLISSPGNPWQENRK